MIVSEKQLQDERAKLCEGGQLQEPTESESGLETVHSISDALPPQYSEHVYDAQVTAEGSQCFTESRLPSKPSNFISLVYKDKPIRGAYVIDPLMHIPQHLLPPMNAGETEQDRKNLYFRTKDGSIDVDIWLVGQEDTIAPKNSTRTTLSLSSIDGSITTKINTVKAIAPFLLDIYARDGRVTVLLPRSFHGSLLLTSRDSNVKLSDDLLRESALLSTVDKTRRYFVGNFSDGMSSDDWSGDELKVVSRDGRIAVRYVDEVEPMKSGFFSRMFRS